MIRKSVFVLAAHVTISVLLISMAIAQTGRGVISGRVLLVLVLSFVGALIALGLSWAFLFPR